MTKNRLKYTACLILLLIICSIGQVSAQIPVKSHSASPDEIKKAQAAVEANPDSLGALHAYIKVMGLKNPLLAVQFEIWMQKYPGNLNIPLTIGTAYYSSEMPQAKEFLLKAAAIDPKNAEIWSMLSADAYRRGQNDLWIGYMRKATLADHSNADYASYYLMCFLESNPNEYKRKAFDFIKRFPASEHSAQALYWVAESAKNLEDKISYLEELRQLYPPQKFSASADGMFLLADAYLQTNPEKALALIDEMGGEKDWEMRKEVAESLIRVNKLEQQQNYKEAVTELNQVKLPRYNQINDFIALKKAHLQDKAGDVKGAYDSLAAKFAKLPTDQIDTALELYGTKMGRDKGRIAKDIAAIRYSTAVAAYPFNLGLYTGNGGLSLPDLKGKVVLLTFWFPGCGPCGREFPHFQAAINEFKGEDVAYVGINVLPEQDPYVLPFIKNNKYSFIPLRGNQEFARKNYHVWAEPENFLIDKDGKIIFKNFSIDNTNHRTLEMMISSLLQKGRQSD